MIEISNLSKRYGDCVALRDISLHIRAGEILAVLGPNGSGKTTLLKCIAGLVTPGDGRVLVHGVDVRHNPREAKRCFSYLPQRLRLPEEFTAREVLKFYARMRKLPASRAYDFLHGSALNGFGDRLLRDYSDGMRQRLGLAIALLPDTPILLLDEPTNGLDPSAASWLRELLNSSRDAGKTVVFSSHLLAEAESLADRAAILLQGRLVAVESVAELRDRVASGARMRLTLGNPAQQWCAVACEAGAVAAALEAEILTVTCPPDTRTAIIRTLETSGARIERLSTEEPTLEQIYLRYVRENSGCDSPAAASGVPDSRSAAAGN